MRYQFNILNTASFVFIAGCIVYTIAKYQILSEEEGWGLVAMIALIGIAFIAIIVEWVLQKFIFNNRSILNMIELCLLIVLGLSIFLG